MAMIVGMVLKLYTSVAKGLKLKFRKFWVLIPMFLEVTGGKLVRGGGFLPPILNKVKIKQDVQNVGQFWKT